jgi:zinc finger-like protein
MKDPDKKILGCQHYQRNVKILAECCQRFFVCRHCHNVEKDHQINRYATKTMVHARTTTSTVCVCVCVCDQSNNRNSRKCVVCAHVCVGGQYCMVCRTVQAKGPACLSPVCQGKHLALYYCSVCNFWDNTPGKSIFHCPVRRHPTQPNPFPLITTAHVCGVCVCGCACAVLN